MKVLPLKVIEVESEGLVSLLGELVFVLCFKYFYYGKLVGVNETCIKLENVYQVFETGPFSEKVFRSTEKLANEWYIEISAIESFGKSLKTPK